MFGSHFATAVDMLFTEAARTGLRVTAGLVVSDRLLRDELLTHPSRPTKKASPWPGAGTASAATGTRSHRGSRCRARTACWPSCAALLKDAEDCWFTSHINENSREIATVARLFGPRLPRHLRPAPADRPAQHPGAQRYPSDAELKGAGRARRLGRALPDQQLRVGQRPLPARPPPGLRSRVALGSDVGAGTGFSLLKEGLQAYFMQQLLAEHGYHLEAAHLLHLATAAGADALGMADQVGDLSVGKRFDAQWIRPAAGSTFDVALRTPPATMTPSPRPSPSAPRVT